METDARSPKKHHAAIAAVAVLWGLFHILTGNFGLVPGLGQRIIHVGFALTYLYLQCLLEPRGGAGRRALPGKAVAAVLLACAAATTCYGLLYGSEAIGAGAGRYTPMGVLMGGVFILLLGDAVRRKVGWALTIITALFLLYARFGFLLPGFLGHKGYSWSRIVSHVYLSYEGVYGTAIGASATFIALFILFGALLQVTGSGELFSRVAQGAFGKYRGGPAKIAVVASGLFGSISGSAAANVAGTGNFTIPLMKSNGFDPAFAGGVESAASTGGQLMPPVMGVAAFLIAEYLSMPYVEVVKSALLPALLFYFGVFWAVDLYSVRNNLKGLDKRDLPAVKPALKKGWPLLTPLVLLLVLMIVVRTSAMKAAFWSIITLLAVWVLTQWKSLRLSRFIEFFVSAADSLVTVVLACAAAGIVIGVFSLTGLGVKFSSVLLAFSGGRLMGLLLLTMVAALILGMGLPTVSAYIVLATLIAPSLVELGITPMAAHLFVFYFGMLSNLTPPVAIAAYTAAGIAGSNPLKTGICSVKIALPGFILPYVFVHNPAMLLINTTWSEVLVSVGTAVVGICALGSALYGQLGRRQINRLQRALMFAGAVMMIISDYTASFFGLILLIAAAALGRLSKTPSGTSGAA